MSNDSIRRRYTARQYFRKLIRRVAEQTVLSTQDDVTLATSPADRRVARRHHTVSQLTVALLDEHTHARAA